MSLPVSFNLLPGGFGLSSIYNTLVQPVQQPIGVLQQQIQAEQSQQGIIANLTTQLNSLQSATNGISTSPAQIQSTLQNFVTAYNSVAGVVNQQVPTVAPPSYFAPSAPQLGSNTLVGDPTVLKLQSDLGGITTLTGGPAGNTYTSLAQIGITTDQNGLLSINSTQLQNALSTDSNAVGNLLTGTNGVVGQIGQLISNYTDPISGLLPADTGGINDQIALLNTNLSHASTAAAVYQQNLQTSFQTLEQQVAGYGTYASLLQQGSGLGPGQAGGYAGYSGLI